MWVLDEPFSALDAGAVEGIAALLVGHLARGGMIVYTTHQDVPLGSAPERVLALMTDRLTPAPFDPEQRNFRRSPENREHGSGGGEVDRVVAPFPFSDTAPVHVQNGLELSAVEGDNGG